MFTKLLATLIYHTHNVHLLHWKTAGVHFQPNHEFLDGLYGEMNGQIDLVAELGLQINEDPLTLSEALQILNSDEINHVGISSKESYDDDKTFTAVKAIFEEIINELEIIFKDPALTEGARNDLANMHSWYLKRARYLIPRRFIK